MQGGALVPLTITEPGPLSARLTAIVRGMSQGSGMFPALYDNVKKTPKPKGGKKPKR